METLNDLPETLYEHYDRVLKTINAQSKPVRELALEALWCVAGSLRRLQGSELVAAIFGFRNPKAIPATGVDPARIVQASYNLLVVSPGGAIGFAHYSVLEYLTSEHLQDTEASSSLRKYALDLEECRFRVTTICLHCLEAVKQGRTHPLKRYARTEAPSHLRQVDVRHLGTKLHPPLCRSYVPLQYGLSLRMSSSSIQFVVQLGLSDLLEELLDKGAYGDMQDLEGALCFAFTDNGTSYQRCQQALLRHGVHLGAASPLPPIASFPSPVDSRRPGVQRHFSSSPPTPPWSSSDDGASSKQADRPQIMLFDDEAMRTGFGSATLEDLNTTSARWGL
jgi:hypothetical protein